MAPLTFDHNFGNRRPIFKIFDWWISEKICNLYAYIIENVYPTISIFLHYLVKLENYNCCQFQCMIYVAYETSEVISEDITQP